MTEQLQRNDNLQDKSNVLFLLQSIERIYHLCQDVLNTYARTSLMLSLAIEAHMLQLKLRVMRERWQYHLPFKEACKVDFEDWGRKIKKMAKSFDPTETTESNEPVSEYCPSKHFLLDLYDTLPENTDDKDYQPYYKETTIRHFLASQEKMRKEMTELWNTYYKQAFSDFVVSDLEKDEGLDLSLLKDDDEDISDTCFKVLTILSEELFKLSDLSEPDILPEHFSRLAERVFYEAEYTGQAARKSARHDVKEWKNKTPKSRQEVTRKEEIETSIKIINEMRYGHLLAEYIGEEYEIKDHSESIGQFLHRVRKHITSNELGDLMEQLYRIRYFREIKEQEEAAEAAKRNEVTEETRRSDGPSALQTPQRPKLDRFFNQKLSKDVDAVCSFYDLLHRTERYMYGRFTAEEKNSLDTKMYKQWKWNHLRVAFVKSGLIDRDTAKQAFAEFIVKVFPYYKKDTIVRGIQRYNETSPGFDKIVEEIIYEFKDVCPISNRS